jgi:hypothetical protein
MLQDLRPWPDEQLGSNVGNERKRVIGISTNKATGLGRRNRWDLGVLIGIGSGIGTTVGILLANANGTAIGIGIAFGATFGAAGGIILSTVLSSFRR